MQHLTTEQLIDFLHDALTPDVDADIHVHLSDCSLCRTEYDREVGLTELLRDQAVIEERDLPPMLKASIWQAVRESRQSRAQMLVSWLRPAYAIPVAAALVIGAFFAPAYLHIGANQAPPTIEAAYYLQDHAAMTGSVPFGDHSGASSSEFETTASLDETAVNSVPLIHTADAAQ